LELDRELQSHFELETEVQQQSGSSPEEAQYAARRTFGNRALVKENVRAIWTLIWLERFQNVARMSFIQKHRKLLRNTDDRSFTLC